MSNQPISITSGGSVQYKLLSTQVHCSIQRCTYVTLATESFEQIVRLELILLVGHHSGHLERQPGLGHLVLEQPLTHGIERRRHHVARAHRPEIVHHEHWTFFVRLKLLQVYTTLGNRNT